MRAARRGYDRSDAEQSMEASRLDSVAGYSGGPSIAPLLLCPQGPGRPMVDRSGLRARIFYSAIFRLRPVARARAMEK